MRAVALHRDVLLVSSALLAANCVIARGGGAEPECFVIDSPVLPEELQSLASLLAQAGFPEPSGLLATHADWDHLLGRLAFPGLALGCAESTARRLAERPGEAQRELRDFDEELYIERPAPLSLGQLQGLPTPGSCELGSEQLELHPTAGHTADGMAIALPWAGVLVAGDYLSCVEIPLLGHGGDPGAYLATLARLRELLARFEQVVPGHGPELRRERALALLEQDEAYLHALLGEDPASAQLPEGRRGREQRRLHERNVAALGRC